MGSFVNEISPKMLTIGARVVNLETATTYADMTAATNGVVLKFVDLNNHNTLGAVDSGAQEWLTILNLSQTFSSLHNFIPFLANSGSLRALFIEFLFKCPNVPVGVGLNPFAVGIGNGSVTLEYPALSEGICPGLSMPNLSQLFIDMVGAAYAELGRPSSISERELLIASQQLMRIGMSLDKVSASRVILGLWKSWVEAFLVSTSPVYDTATETWLYTLKSGIYLNMTVAELIEMVGEDGYKVLVKSALQYSYKFTDAVITLDGVSIQAISEDSLREAYSKGSIKAAFIDEGQTSAPLVVAEVDKGGLFDTDLSSDDAGGFQGLVLDLEPLIDSTAGDVDRSSMWESIELKKLVNPVVSIGCADFNPLSCGDYLGAMSQVKGLKLYDRDTDRTTAVLSSPYNGPCVDSWSGAKFKVKSEGVGSSVVSMIDHKGGVKDTMGDMASPTHDYLASLAATISASAPAGKQVVFDVLDEAGVKVTSGVFFKNIPGLFTDQLATNYGSRPIDLGGDFVIQNPDDSVVPEVLEGFGGLINSTTGFVSLDSLDRDKCAKLASKGVPEWGYSQTIGSSFYDLKSFDTLVALEWQNCWDRVKAVTAAGDSGESGGSKSDNNLFWLIGLGVAFVAIVTIAVMYVSSQDKQVSDQSTQPGAEPAQDASKSQTGMDSI